MLSTPPSRRVAGSAQWQALGTQRRAARDRRRPDCELARAAVERELEARSTARAAASAPTPSSRALNAARAAPTPRQPAADGGAGAGAARRRADRRRRRSDRRQARSSSPAMTATGALLDPPRRGRERAARAHGARAPGVAADRARSRERGGPAAARRQARPRRHRQSMGRRPRCGGGARLAAGCGALVSLGGDIATAGTRRPAAGAIRVTDDHRSDAAAPGQTVSIDSGGLATSSTAVRRWSHDGHTMHHIIDPDTGAPVRESWRTVSVAAACCTDANIAATAAIVRGRRGGRVVERARACPRGWSPAMDASAPSAAGPPKRRPDAGSMSAVLATAGPSVYWYLTRSTGAVALLLLTPRDRSRRGRRASAGAPSAGRASWSTRCTATSRCWRWRSWWCTSSPRCSTASRRSRSLDAVVPFVGLLPALLVGARSGRLRPVPGGDRHQPAARADGLRGRGGRSTGSHTRAGRSRWCTASAPAAT